MIGHKDTRRTWDTKDRDTGHIDIKKIRTVRLRVSRCDKETESGVVQSRQR